MLKWVICLCAAMYGTLVIFGDGPPARSEKTTVISSVVTAVEPDPVVEPVTPVKVAVEKAEPAVVKTAKPVAIAKKVLPQSSATAPIVKISATLPVAPSKPVIAELPKPALAVWEVTGSRVNLRSGPSTGSRVLGKATRGQTVELIERTGDGWALIYLPDNGIEAFISDQFVAER